MYPTFYDLFLDLTGLSVPPFRFMQSYGLMVGIGFIVGSIIFILELKRKERNGQLKAIPQKKGSVDVLVHPDEHVGNIVILTGIGAVVGGKLFHNLENWQQTLADPLGAITRMSGFSFFGGMIVGMALFIWYARKKHLKTLHFIDAAMPAVTVGYAFGRLGCHISGDGDWGIPNDMPKPEVLSMLPDWLWAYDYPNNVLGVNLIDYFASKGYTSMTGFAFPTPLYEIILSVLIFAILWSMRKRWTTPGMMVSAYFILGGGERLLIEQIRINNKYDILGGITQAEIIAASMILLGIMGAYFLPKGLGLKWAKF